MPAATKITFGLAGVVMILAVLAVSYLDIRTGHLEAESINAPTQQERLVADELVWKHRAYFRRVWLLPALGTVLSFFGWIEYFKTSRGERTRGEVVAGSTVTLAHLSMLALYGAVFLAALGGH